MPFLSTNSKDSAGIEKLVKKAHAEKLLGEKTCHLELSVYGKEVSISKCKYLFFFRKPTCPLSAYWFINECVFIEPYWTLATYDECGSVVRILEYDRAGSGLGRQCIRLEISWVEFYNTCVRWHLGGSILQLLEAPFWIRIKFLICSLLVLTIYLISLITFYAIW